MLYRKPVLDGKTLFMAILLANSNVKHNVPTRISIFMSSWEIYSFRLVMGKRGSWRGESYKEAIL